MYDTIVNPKTNRKVCIKSKLGKFILRNYILNLKGGGKKNLINCVDKFGKFLGRGAYKKVYKTDCGKKYWEKEGEFSSSFTESDCNNSVIVVTREDSKKFNKEINIQKTIKGPKIWLNGNCEDVDYRYKIEEKLDAELHDWINNCGKYNINILDRPIMLINFKKTFLNVLNQVKILHDANIGHFDIKPSNIMAKYTALQIRSLNLIDYGLSNISPIDKMSGTPGYIDPDFFIYNTLTLKSDIYSLGITLINCVLQSFGEFNIDTKYKKKEDKYAKILRMLPNSDESVEFWASKCKLREIYNKDPTFVDLLYNMLISPRENRYSIEQVICHPWFNFGIISSCPIL